MHCTLIKAERLRAHAVFHEMCTLLGINKTRTMACHPQLDGLVECFNHTLMNSLSRCADDNQWD